MTSLWHFLSCASHRTENFHLAKVIEPQFPLGFFLFSIEFQSVIYMSVICIGVEGVCLLNDHQSIYDRNFELDTKKSDLLILDSD